MPVTTILQHQNERERHVEADLDTPMTNNEDNLSIGEMLEKIRIDWAPVIHHRYTRASPLSNQKRTATVTGRWIPPDSSYRSTLLNGRSSSNLPRHALPSSRQAPPEIYHTRQTNSKNFNTERGGSTTHHASPAPPVSYRARRASRETQQVREVSPTTYDAQPASSMNRNARQMSPSTYIIAQTAYNALGVHRAAGTSPNRQNERQMSSANGNAVQTSNFQPIANYVAGSDFTTSHFIATNDNCTAKRGFTIVDDFISNDNATAGGHISSHISRNGSLTAASNYTTNSSANGGGCTAGNGFRACLFTTRDSSAESANYTASDDIARNGNFTATSDFTTCLSTISDGQLGHVSQSQQ
ncbi:hypothetical protein V8C37DRAFT_404282 [Trichoderma ceciliae]